MRRCKNPIVDPNGIELFCWKPLTKVGVGQYVCRSCLARVAGSKSSDRKKASSAANGRKGGRPRKPKPCECGCGRMAPGGMMEFAHPEDYRDERG